MGRDDGGLSTELLLFRCPLLFLPHIHVYSSFSNDSACTLTTTTIPLANYP